jgi:hypothetical protein
MRKGKAVMKRFLAVAGGVMIFIVMGGTVQAIDLAPEVDPGSMASALTLLAGGGLLLADRLLRKVKAR